MRFSKNGLNHNLTEMQENLVVVPRLHFLLSSFSPINSLLHHTNSNFSSNSSSPMMGKELPSIFHSLKPDISNQTLKLLRITEECFHSNYQFANADPLNGLYMACSLSYRGNVQPQNVNTVLALLKARGMIKFVDW